MQTTTLQEQELLENFRKLNDNDKTAIMKQIKDWVATSACYQRVKKMLTDC